MKTWYARDWVPLANRWLETKAGQYDAKSAYLPAGATPQKLYANWRNGAPAVVRQLEFHQLDDIIDGERGGMFAEYFESELPSFNVQAPISEVQCDLAILGLGVNGHVAFHEPGIPPEFAFGIVTLEDDTAERLDVDYDTQAITYGIGALMKTKAILLLVGGNKQVIFNEAVAGNDRLPVSFLLEHPDLTVLIEE